MPTPYRTQRRVEFVDTDMAGIVHFTNFFRFMESAEQEFLRSVGLSVTMTWNNQELGFPRVAASCDYLQPARFGDLIDITVTVEKVGQKSVTYRHEFFKEGKLIAHGRITSVFCLHSDTGIAAIEIPAFLRERLATMSAPSPEASPPAK